LKATGSLSFGLKLPEPLPNMPRSFDAQPTAEAGGDCIPSRFSAGISMWKVAA